MGEQVKAGHYGRGRAGIAKSGGNYGGTALGLLRKMQAYPKTPGKEQDRQQAG